MSSPHKKPLALVGGVFLLLIAIAAILGTIRNLEEAPSIALSLYDRTTRVFSDTPTGVVLAFWLGVACLVWGVSDHWLPWVSRHMGLPVLDPPFILTPQQERLLRIIAEHQKRLAASKLIISRTCGRLYFDEAPDRGHDTNLIRELFGNGAEDAAEKFVSLVESIPSDYLRLFPETRFDNPFVVSVTEKGTAYLMRVPSAMTPASGLSFEVEGVGARWLIMQHGRMDCYVSVRNLSTTKTVNHVKVLMEWHSTGERSRTQIKEVALKLQFEDGNVADIPPTGIKHFRLCSILDEPWPPDPSKQAYIGRVAFAPQGDNLTDLPKYRLATYEVHLRAEGRDVQPERAVYELQALDATVGLRQKPERIGSNWPSDP